MTIVNSPKDPAVDDPIDIAVACFLAITAYNFLELNVIIFTTFKKRNGLYFWSFIVATWGTLVHGVGITLRQFRLVPNGFYSSPFTLTGWYAMVTGQSVVLYSRLHLILKDRTRLRAVLIMIIVDAIICHVPLTVLRYGASSNNPDPFLRVMPIFEKIQITTFFLQEIIISGLYIHATANFLRNNGIARGNRNHNMMKHLLCVNVIIILLDIGIPVLEYANLPNFQRGYKGFVYSLKLKLEFNILNRLIDVAKFRAGTYNNQSGSNGNTDAPSTKDKTWPRPRARLNQEENEEFKLQHDINVANNSTLMMGRLSASPSEQQLVINAQSGLTQEPAIVGRGYAAREPASPSAAS